MEMAAAHGLALKLVEMNRLDRINRNECEIISEEDRVIKSWLLASNQRFSKLDYFNLTRKTLLFVLSQSSLKETKKKELLRGVSIYFNKFSNLLKNNLDIRKPLIDVIVDPWKNTCFSWEELFRKRITIQDRKVQEYFCAEPEEVVMARVHLFLIQGKEEMAMILAKSSFLFHSRIAKNFSVSSEHQIHNQKSNPVVLKYKHRRGSASIDWYLYILQRKKSLSAIVSEAKQLTCHEGVLLVQRLRRSKKNSSFAINLLQIFLMQELICPSKFCCTKKIFSLWCIMHKEQKTAMDVINLEIRKIIAMYAPSSAHFYLLVDTLWEQFGSSFITLYVELYVRGLTVDLNHLEAAKNGETQDDIVYLESHIASMFAKLSTLFSDFHEGASRECMFSAFSLKPTKERLYILQSLTHSILSSENDMKSNSSLIHSSASLKDCKCTVKCADSCKSMKEHFLEHPILMKGIPNVPYCVVKDLVSVLEGVRCILFQYNVFDWHNNATDLGDYLKEFTLSKSWESDTEYASEGSIKSDEDNPSVTESLYPSKKIDAESLHSSIKRKSESDNVKEMFSLEIGANIEVGNEDIVNKRIKTVDQNKSTEIDKHDIFKTCTKPTSNFSSALVMEDAIENVIRMTLDNNRLKSDLALDNSHNIFLNTLDHSHDGTEKLSLSSAFKHASENHVYPYSLTSYGKKNNLSSNFKVTECTPSAKSDLENSVKYPYFAAKPITAAHVHASPHVNRESVISPVVNKHKNLNNVQEQSCRQMAQNKFVVKTVNIPCYNRGKDSSASTVDIGKKVSMYQQEALNLGCKSTIYEPIRIAPNTVTQNSQFISNQTAMQILHKPGISTPDFSKTPNQFLPNTSVVSSSLASPVNLTQSKETIPMHHSIYSPVPSHVSKSSVFKTDSRYQVVNSNVSKAVMKRVDQSISCFQDNQFVHCDRSSVIQHTMQHVRENLSLNQSNEIEMPNQLSVSVNSNAAEQIRSIPKKDITNLPPFTVNVTDRTMSNSSLAVSANLVIARKPQPQVEVSSQPVSSDLKTVRSTDTITIPGILASPSVIVSPWEAQHKVHGEMLYKKNANVVNASTIDKRIYKNRIPYGRQSVFKPEPKMIGQKVTNDKSNTQVFKDIASPSHISSTYCTVPSMNQSNTNSSRNWSVVNKLSTHGTSHPTSSQPWYSEPYPKPYNSGNNISPKSNGNFNVASEQNTSSTVKLLQPPKHVSEVKSVAVYTKQLQSSNNHLMVIPTVVSTASDSFNNIVPSSSTKSSVLNLTTHSSPNSTTCATSSKSILHKDPTPSSSFQSNSMVNIKTYSTDCNPVKINAVESSQFSGNLQLSADLVQDKNYVVYTVPNAADSNFQYSEVASKNFPKSCCSPSEVNPCQNCSLPANRVVQTSSETNSNGCPEHFPSSKKMVLGNDMASSVPCSSQFSSNKDSADSLEHSNANATVVSCQYCSHPFLETELQMHILNCHSKEFEVKSGLISELNSNMMVPENFCTKSLPDVVPEQDSLFQKGSFHNNLPHAKSFMNAIENPHGIAEDKPLDEMEANAFSACMDLINNDKDLKRIVQGIDSLNQVDNNYLPFIPSTDPSSNFLNVNLPDDQKNFSEAPLQNSVISDKNNDFNNYVNCEQPQFQENKLDVGKPFNSVFEFTEKECESSKSVQKLVHSKPQTSYTERISVSTSKTSNELTFSAIAEMIKVTITEDGHNELESIETCLKDSQKEISQMTENIQKVECATFSCPYCSKKLRSALSVRRHVAKLHPTVHVNDSESILSSRLIGLSSANKSDCNIQFESGVNSASGNSYDSSTSVNYTLNSDVKQNPVTSSTSEMCNVLPKGRIKGFIKSPTSQCKFCKKILTSVYMKKHILKKHQEITIKTDNSSCDLNSDVNVTSQSQVDSANICTVSPLLEQDIDSSTCLSMSDALKRNTYVVAETSNISEGSNKLTENTDIKFNFNVLEFSKDAKTDSKIPVSASNTPLKHGEPPPKNINNFEENKIQSYITYTKQNKCIEHRHSCNLCNKSYASISVLNRHLKTIHKVSIIRTSKKNKTEDQLKESGMNSKIERNEPVPPNIFNKASDTNVEISGTSNKKKSVQFSEEVPHVPRVSQSSACFIQRTKEKCKSLSSPNLNRNLLKAVLHSNFVSKQLEMKDCHESKKITSAGKVSRDCGEKLNFCDASKFSENNQKQCNEQLNEINCSSANEDCKDAKGNMYDPKLKSDNEISVLVPFENLSKTETLINSDKCSYSLIPNTEVYDQSSVSTNFEIADVNNELHEANQNSQIKFSNLIDSQNISIQSSEISPISEIISNVSKCHFGGTSNNDNEKEIFEDNSLKLLIPENQIESTSNKNCNESIDDSYGRKMMQEQEFLQESCVNASGESVISSEKMNELTDKKINELIDNNSISGEKEIIKESYELENALQNSDKNCIRCRLCHQKLDSMETLSKHLKEIHDIPVLKKHISQPCSLNKLSSSEKPGKLSPPKLKLGTNESDSESVSDFDNPGSWSKTYSSELDASKGTLYDSSEIDACKGIPYDSSQLNASNEALYNSSALDAHQNETLQESNLCGSLSPLPKQGEQDEETIVHNLTCKLKKSFGQIKHKNKINHSNSFSVQSMSSFNPDSECQLKLVTSPTYNKCKIRRHSFSDTSSVFSETINPLVYNSENVLFGLKDNKNLKRKSVSLPNLKISFQLLRTSQVNQKIVSTNPSFEEHTDIEHSSEGNTSLSSVTDNTEICKSSCDSSSLSRNSPIQWNKITINSSFLLPNPVLSSSVPRFNRSKTILRSKISGRKLIIQRLKTYKKEKKFKKKAKSGDFSSHKKLKSKIKPIILTLKETAEISEFLKTHKQPVVKLIRLEENEFDYLLNQKSDPVSEIICNKYNMKEAVVKLERMHVPCDIDKMVLINQELLVPNLLSQDSHDNSVSMQNHQNENINCPNGFYLASSDADILPEVSIMHNPPKDIELTVINNSDSSTASDSVQFLGTVTRQECQIKTEFCSIPSTKKCFVVLNRI